MFPLSSLATRLVLLGAIATSVLLPSSKALAIDLTQKTVSNTKQFIVYSPDAGVRARVASAAEEIKSEVLQLLNEHDGPKKSPIVITIDRARTEDTGKPPVQFGVYGFEGGFKIGIDVRIGDKPEEVNLQRHIVRAVLIEYAYRYKPEALSAGGSYLEPPWWLVEGAIQITRKKQQGVDADFYKRLIDVNHLPKLEEFLAGGGEIGGRASAEIDQACAMCLLQLLIDQPEGRNDLARMLRRLPEGNADPVAMVTREFPAFPKLEALQREWTLCMARFSAADRYRGLTAEETDAQLAMAVQFDLPTSKDGKGTDHRTFAIAQYDEYLKLPASRAALLHGQTQIVTLSAQASALYRPILNEYGEIFALLARGKTKGIKQRIAAVEKYRETILRRTADIADYLNWYEATQVAEKTKDFDSYMKIANDLEKPAKRNDPISRYLDEISQEY